MLCGTSLLALTLMSVGFDYNFEASSEEQRATRYLASSHGAP